MRRVFPYFFENHRRKAGNLLNYHVAGPIFGSRSHFGNKGQTIILIFASVDILVLIKNFRVLAFIHRADRVIFIIITRHIKQEDKGIFP